MKEHVQSSSLVDLNIHIWDTRRASGLTDRVRGKRMSQEESKYLWVMRTSRKFAAGRRDSNRAFQSRSLRSRGTRRLGKVKKRIERWSRLYVGKLPGKIHDREGPRNKPVRRTIAELLRAFLCLRHFSTVRQSFGCWMLFWDERLVATLSRFAKWLPWFLKSLTVRFGKTISSQISL